MPYARCPVRTAFQGLDKTRPPFVPSQCQVCSVFAGSVHSWYGLLFLAGVFFCYVVLFICGFADVCRSWLVSCFADFAGLFVLSGGCWSWRVLVCSPVLFIVSRAVLETLNLIACLGLFSPSCYSWCAFRLYTLPPTDMELDRGSLYKEHDLPGPLSGSMLIGEGITCCFFWCILCLLGAVSCLFLGACGFLFVSFPSGLLSNEQSASCPCCLRRIVMHVCCCFTGYFPFAEDIFSLAGFAGNRFSLISGHMF